jgi:hypothetical protein
MHKSATKCNETMGKWYKNKHGASKIIDTFETYQGSSKILNKLQEMIFLLRRRRRRSIKQLHNPLKQVKILIVFLFLMLKLNQVMLLIKKKLKRNQKRLTRMQSTPKKISLPTSMVMRENLGFKNQCLFLVRNTSPRKKNSTTGFVNG